MTVRTERCRSCKAPVVWAFAEDKGKKVILDAEPVENGNIVQTKLDPQDGLTVRYLRRGEAVPSLAPRYQSHFVSCPDAESFRKGK